MAGCSCKQEAPSEPRTVLAAAAMGRSIGAVWLLRKVKIVTLFGREVSDQRPIGSGPADHGFWFLFYSHLMDELGIEGDGLRDLLVENTRISANWCDIRPGTKEILRRLGKRYCIGVISNADGQIASVLKHCGIADCFQIITDSGLVGCEKPRAEIFQAALREMDVRPEESLYVGDVYSVDYLGATRAGLQAILFDVAGAYSNNGLKRVESLEELERILTA